MANRRRQQRTQKIVMSVIGIFIILAMILSMFRF